MRHVHRRQILFAVCAIVVAPIAAKAQQTGKVRRVGLLMGFSENDPQIQRRVSALKEGLAALGWTEGRNVQFDARWSGTDTDRVSVFASELVALRPDVIVSTTTPLTTALRRETTTIPIVFPNAADPVGSGFAKSLSHPGGNVTGSVNFESSLAAKWLEMLTRVAPRVRRVIAMFNPDTAPFFDSYLRPLTSAAKKLGIETSNATARSDAEIEAGIVKCAHARNCGLVMINDSFLANHRSIVIAAAARHKLPAVYPASNYVAEGGLISYGPDQVDLFRRAAQYVDRILRGENAAELPIQLPSRFELAINLKTAKALGLSVPGDLLLRADQVIE